MFDEEDLFCVNCGVEVKMCVVDVEFVGLEVIMYNFSCDSCGVLMSYDVGIKNFCCFFCSLEKL